jgi:hypothetical protein
MSQSTPIRLLPTKLQSQNITLVALTSRYVFHPRLYAIHVVIQYDIYKTVYLRSMAFTALLSCDGCIKQ